MNKPLLTAGALLLGSLIVGAPTDASADIRVRIGGGIRIGTPRATWSRPVYRPYYRPRYAIGGSIWVGGGYYGGYSGARTYAAPPPPPPSCECGPSAVPSYYPGYYQTAQPTYYTAPPAAAAELPRFALGGFMGGTDVDGEAGNDVGLLARFRISGGWMIEGEMGAATTETRHLDGQPADHRIGASVLYEIGARNTWAPYLVASVGGVKSGAAHSMDEARGYGEVGIGLRWALTDNLHLAADVRAGSVEQPTDTLTDPVPLEGAAARVVTPIGPDEPSGQSYTRARLSAMLYF